MSKINVLSFEIANLIAAGEVVERPASVLKELIENSIDSGATEIVAEIKKGGVALIRVSDNGTGIEKDDLPIALKRHATSKIKEKDDLNSIMTLGFRGEALAAISSVSVMTIISKTRAAETATMMTAEAGSVVDISEVGASNGTTVVVENLFYNVPARRKFLKKDSTEASNVTALVEKVALSRPDISIQLLVDGEEKFKTPGDSDLLNTIYSVFGKDFAKKMIRVDGSSNGIRVSGYIGRSDNVRKNRNLQNVFINGRYVKSLTAMAAIEKAYTSYIAPECFPTCVLFLEMNPGIVDVNVHPAKLEVKFSDERIVFESVYYTVKNALEREEYRPELTLKTKGGDYNPIGAFVAIGEDTKGKQISLSQSDFASAKPSVSEKISSHTTDFSRKYDSAPRRAQGDYDAPMKMSSSVKSSTGFAISYQEMTPKSSLELLEKYRTATVENTQTPVAAPAPIAKAEPSLPEIPEHKIIGEAFDCYVMVEYDGALLIIDKHAAHERVIFEDLKKNNSADGRIASQSLLLPISVILTPDELTVAEEFREEFSNVGFEFVINGKAADITAVPAEIDADDAEALFVKMADEISEGRGNPQVTDSVRREKALYQIACKAAIKGGRRYDKAIIEWLVGKVLTIPDITVCPHGRPIAYRLSKNELDRRFDRLK